MDDESHPATNDDDQTAATKPIVIEPSNSESMDQQRLNPKRKQRKKKGISKSPNPTSSNATNLLNSNQRPTNKVLIFGFIFTFFH